MWKNLAFVFCLFAKLIIAQEHNHLAMLKQEFPFGLLTDDYGILTRDDLKINICLAGAAPFVIGTVLLKTKTTFASPALIPPKKRKMEQFCGAGFLVATKLEKAATPIFKMSVTLQRSALTRGRFGQIPSPLITTKKRIS